MELHLPVPPTAPALLRAPGSGIEGLDAEQGHKGAGAKGAGGVEVGVVGCPAGHDLLVVHQRVTGTAQGAARQQNLQAKNRGKNIPPGFQALDLGSSPASLLRDRVWWVCAPQSAWEGRSSLPGKAAGRTRGCH